MLVVLGATALAPRAVLAQAKAAPILIGWLNTDSRELSGQNLSSFSASEIETALAAVAKTRSEAIVAFPDALVMRNAVLLRANRVIE